MRNVTALAALPEPNVIMAYEHLFNSPFCLKNKKPLQLLIELKLSKKKKKRGTKDKQLNLRMV